eukprot:Protomagalhaensia_wolfi_Nauph_80__1753@NODE_2093_length_1215_cov_51_394558_g1634_i0_p2_GENE_NODE_2093_length_1215_cov_51_394558_g1634_i0NODE_2093_length_1215_cov_51_394558_g1634_i0_p2_ORF_typecomplete_len156_score31_81SNAP/PF14938_6/5_9e26TPR_12/PF13424_6/5_8e06TPR_7/PF13176_6/3_8e03TPR_7/PF13176_6/0_21TPR_7/PF13176_6/14TPR_1/PF00515_28/2_6e03TPR_1/PF00515_28/0_0028TPR_1/PF00515_28/1_3e03TPR_2/PF07719_17/1_4e03TPR_2/PF07719_17/0_0054TPR_2/PF07719_17/1_1e02TPR_MalT/PF17874_1/0_016TPR_16/PF13432_6
MAGDAARFKEEAERKLKGGFLAFVKGGPKYDEASELFANAGNLYKVQKMWNDAADCYERAAEMQAKLDDRTQEAKFYVEAGHVLRNVSTASAAEKYDLAAKLYVKSGRFSQAARLMKVLDLIRISFVSSIPFMFFLMRPRISLRPWLRPVKAKPV